MAKKTQKVTLSQDEKRQLKALRDKGLYKPKNARKPTKYAKSLLRKYTDVLTGNAGVITVSASDFKNYNSKKSGEIRTVRNKLIVPKLPGEHVTYSKKTHKVSVTRRLKTGERYIRQPFKERPKTVDDLFSQLGEKDRIAVAYNRGRKKPVEWHYFDADEFYKTFVGGYTGNAQGSAAQIKALEWALNHAMVSSYKKS